MRKGGKLAGWKVEKLGNVIQKTETINPLQTPNKEFIYIDVSSVNNKTLSIEETSLIKGKDAPSRARKLIKAGDVIFATVRPTLKRIAVIPEEYDNQVCSTGYFVFRGKEFINNKYLFYYLQTDSFNERMEKLQKGASYPAVTDAEVKEQIISYPPLPEQQRIVSVLDEAFASIAQVKSNAEQNMVNARELFESVMEEIFGNGKDWGEKKLFEIGDTQTGTTPKTSEKKNYGDYIPFIKPADIDISGDGEIRYDNEGLSETGLQNGRLMSAGSVLMVCIGASIGKVGFADRDVSCNQQINAFTVNKPNYPKFFYYALRTQGFYNKVIKNSAQATLPIINKSKWENLTIRFPESLVEQRAIVGRLEALSAETGRLEEIYWQKLESLEELKKSVLGKAFEGSL